MDPKSHARYLDYRERHVYFGSGKKRLLGEEFAALDAELTALEARVDAVGDERLSDEDEERLAELRALLFRD